MARCIHGGADYGDRCSQCHPEPPFTQAELALIRDALDVLEEELGVLEEEFIGTSNYDADAVDALQAKVGAMLISESHG